MTYTILFSLDNRHFNLTNIKISEKRRFHYQLGDTIYVYEATLKQVTSEPTAKSTGSGVVTVKALRTSYNADIVCNIAKKSIRNTIKAKIEEIAGTNHKEWCVQSHRSHTHQGTKHHCIFEINKETKKHKFVDDYGEDYTAADEMCQSMNNFRTPDMPVYFCVRCLEPEEFEYIENYNPFLTAIVETKTMGGTPCRRH